MNDLVPLSQNQPTARQLDAENLIDRWNEGRSLQTLRANAANLKSVRRLDEGVRCLASSLPGTFSLFGAFGWPDFAATSAIATASPAIGNEAREGDYELVGEYELRRARPLAVANRSSLVTDILTTQRGAWRAARHRRLDRGAGA